MRHKLEPPARIRSPRRRTDPQAGLFGPGPKMGCDHRAVSRRTVMPIAKFGTELAEELRRGSIDSSVRTEQALERSFVIPIAKRIAERHPDTLVFTHPFRNRLRCSNTCTP